MRKKNMHHSTACLIMRYNDLFLVGFIHFLVSFSKSEAFDDFDGEFLSYKFYNRQSRLKTRDERRSK
jgi:hypothetical protein